MSLQKQITLLVSGILTSMLLIMLMFSVSGANKNFTVERLTQIDPRFTDLTIENNIPTDVNKEDVELNHMLAKARIAFSSNIMLVWLVLIIIGTLITYKLVGKSLQSLVNLQKTMENLDTGNIGKQISLDEKQPREVQALSMSYNEMTARLDESFLKQKNFVHNAAHELKTPLAVIITYTQLLQMNAAEADLEHKKMTEAILSSCDKLSKTQEQLLLLANDNLLQLTDTIDAQYLINELFNELKSHAIDKGMVLKNNNSKNYSFKGNKVMLSVALKNLIENAIKYGEADSEITVFTRVSAKQIYFEVKNQGQEITEAEIDRIFEPFYRGEKNTNQIIGNGLGLSLVKKIVEDHGGEVFCKPQGKEVLFSFSIPVH